MGYSEPTEQEINQHIQELQVLVSEEYKYGLRIGYSKFANRLSVKVRGLKNILVNDITMTDKEKGEIKRLILAMENMINDTFEELLEES